MEWNESHACASHFSIWGLAQVTNMRANIVMWKPSHNLPGRSIKKERKRKGRRKNTEEDIYLSNN